MTITTKQTQKFFTGTLFLVPVCLLTASLFTIQFCTYFNNPSNNYHSLWKLNNNYLPLTNFTDQKSDNTRSKKCQYPGNDFCSSERNNCLGWHNASKNWSYFVTAARYNLSVCIIPKDLSTVMMAVVCYLHDPDHFKGGSIRRRIYTERFASRACAGMNEFRSMSGGGNNLTRNKSRRKSRRSRRWRMLAVVREPIDRFFSAWFDKCYVRYPEFGRGNRPGYCFNCGRNISCFILKFHSKLSLHGPRRLSNNFQLENHFFPQSWYCQFRDRLTDYTLLRYSSEKRGRFYDRLVDFMNRTLGVERPLLRQIYKEGMSGDSWHMRSKQAKYGRMKDRMERDPALMGLLLQIYYRDYELLGFALPCLPAATV